MTQFTWVTLWYDHFEMYAAADVLHKNISDGKQQNIYRHTHIFIFFSILKSQHSKILSLFTLVAHMNLYMFVDDKRTAKNGSLSQMFIFPRVFKYLLLERKNIRSKKMAQETCQTYVKSMSLNFISKKKVYFLCIAVFAVIFFRTDLILLPRSRIDRTSSTFFQMI